MAFRAKRLRPGNNLSDVASASTALANLGGAPVSALRTTDAAAVNNNSSSFVTDSVLTVPVAANTNYAFEAVVFCDATTTSDFKFKFAVPSGATGLYVPVGLVSTVTSFSGSILRQAVSLGTSCLVGTNGEGTANSVGVSARGVIQVGSTAGNLALMYVQGTASSDPVGLTVRALSFIKREPVG